MASQFHPIPAAFLYSRRRQARPQDTPFMLHAHVCAPLHFYRRAAGFNPKQLVFKQCVEGVTGYGGAQWMPRTVLIIFLE